MNAEKRSKAYRIRSPFYHLQIRTNLPLAPSLSPPRSTNTPLHPSKPHTRATKAQVLDLSRRGVPQMKLTPSSSSRLSPVAPAHRVGDKGAAGHYPSTLLPWGASSGTLCIPTMRAGCQNLRICGKETRLGCAFFGRHVYT